MSADTIPIQVDFGGGLELLFSNQRTFKVNLPSRVPLTITDTKVKEDTTLDAAAEMKPTNLTYLMYYLRDNLLKERPELFMTNGTM